jgi:hypothetical protein
VDFIAEAGRRSRGHFHINVGVFVPKPHTPYERAAQLGEDRARRKLKYIMSALKPLGHKVSVHDPFTAVIEGFIARGDERAGELIEEAFDSGARLDPWSEYFRKDIWQGLFEKNRELVASVLSRKAEESLPWSVVESGTAAVFLKNEETKSGRPRLTSPCIENCTNPCGVCGTSGRVVKNSVRCEVKGEEAVKTGAKSAGPDTWRMLFSFAKKDSAVFVPHLGVIEVFSMAFLRSGLRPVFTRGFNPHLKLEFASPAAVGLVCEGEIACVDFDRYLEPETFAGRLSGALPPGFSVTRAEIFNIPFGTKKHSLPPLLYGFVYADSGGKGRGGASPFGEARVVPKADEKEFRLKHSESSFPVRKYVLAANPAFTETGRVTDDGAADSETANVPPYTGYFDAYTGIMRNAIHEKVKRL